MTKDKTDEYPVTQLADIPERTLKLVDKRLILFEEAMNTRDEIRDAEWAKLTKRTVNVQAGLRVLYMVVGGAIILTLILTGR